MILTKAKNALIGMQESIIHKGKQEKNDYWIVPNLKYFVFLKNYQKKKKNKPKYEKIFPIYISEKGLRIRIYKEPFKKISNKRMGKRFKLILTKVKNNNNKKTTCEGCLIS